MTCMNDWLLRYLYLFTSTCSPFFVYWDLLNPNKLLNWIESLNNMVTRVIHGNDSPYPSDDYKRQHSKTVLRLAAIPTDIWKTMQLINFNDKIMTDILLTTFLNAISKLKTSLYWVKCSWSLLLKAFNSPIDHRSALIMTWHRRGDKRLTKPLTHWCRVTHICVSKLTIIGSDNGLSPGRHQAIIWTNTEILIWPLGKKLRWNTNWN